MKKTCDNCRYGDDEDGGGICHQCIEIGGYPKWEPSYEILEAEIETLKEGRYVICVWCGKAFARKGVSVETLTLLMREHDAVCPGNQIANENKRLRALGQAMLALIKRHKHNSETLHSDNLEVMSLWNATDDLLNRPDMDALEAGEKVALESPCSTCVKEHKSRVAHQKDKLKIKIELKKHKKAVEKARELMWKILGGKRITKAEATEYLALTTSEEFKEKK